MSHRDSLIAIISWLAALPLLIWAGVGGPAAAGVAGTGAFLFGLVFFTAWAAAGGIPPMYVR